ncbi:hypothetical protein ACQUFY_20800 [Robbsia andropogonis]|uniref:hypothetical protein n=1 Tax=Robbsia andropogonis TaxID=28092 RepID=UPI003D1DA81D
MNTKVQINKQARDSAAEQGGESALQQFTRQANESLDVTDARGRVIRLKKPNAIARLGFIEAMGESSSNKLWAATVFPVMYVVSLEGVANSVPISKNEIKALYARLDEDGMAAVMRGLEDLLQEGDDEVDAAAAKK